MNKTLSAIATITVLSFSSIGSANAVDLAKGKKVYNKCRACHTLVAGKHRIGPSLSGVFGRTAGTAKGYKFSKAMKKAGNSGLVWDVTTMSKFLVKPRKYIKGTKMSFAGLKKSSDIKNLVAFLKKAAK